VERREYSRYFISCEIELKEVGSSFPLNRAPELIHEFVLRPAL
jgi:hypothetical protein